MNRDWLFNQLMFQAAWPACVFGAAHGVMWPALVLVGGMAAVQLQPGRRHAGDLRTVGRFVACGVVLDTVWQQAGILVYASPWPVPGVAPLWILLLWLALGLTVHHSLAIFRRRPALFFVLASVGSPLSYFAASRIGAVEWAAAPWLVVLLVGPVWAFIVALLFRGAGQGQCRGGMAQVARP